LGIWFLKYVSGQTETKRHTQTNTLITILPTLTGDEVAMNEIPRVDLVIAKIFFGLIFLNILEIRKDVVTT